MVWSRHGRRDHAVTAWARTRCPGPGVGGACLAIVEWIGPSVVEDGQVELVEARWVGDHVDLGNLVVLDRETDGQAQPGEDPRQASGQVLHTAGVGAAEPQPGLLHGIVGLAQRAEHPVGDPPQVAAVGLESLRQPVVVVHRSPSLVAFRHGRDGPRDETAPTRQTGLIISITTVIVWPAQTPAPDRCCSAAQRRASLTPTV